MAPIYIRNAIFELKGKGLSSTQISKVILTDYRRKLTPRVIRLIISAKMWVPGPRKQREKKFSEVHIQFIDLWMHQNNEITSHEVQVKLKQCFGVSISRSHIRFLRRKLGWSCKQAKYCQLITHVNKLIRFQWSLDMLVAKETFHDVIFTDETSIEMCSSAGIRFYKKGERLDRLPSKAPKPKHSLKVHMWAGISYRGRTHCCIFTGIMDSIIFQQILQDNLIPFVRHKFPDGYRLYMDNDSKHRSKSTKQWMAEVGMLDKVMVTPASSPDLNPIENVWASLKDYLKRHVKPTKKAELVNGIQMFWESLTPDQCGSYIDHMHVVLPVVVLNSGGASGY